MSSYRPFQKRRLNAIKAEQLIGDGYIPDIQSLEDLVEQMYVLRKRNKWWKTVGSRRRTPWSILKDPSVRGAKRTKGE